MGTCKVGQLIVVQHLPRDQDEPKIRLFFTHWQAGKDKSFLHVSKGALISD